MLETAIVLPLLLLMVLGIVELGRVMMLNQVSTNATREGCRRAIIPGASDSGIVDICNQYLDVANVAQTGRQVKILNAAGEEAKLSTISSHEPVTVQIQLPYDENTWGFSSIAPGRTLTTEITMRRE